MSVLTTYRMTCDECGFSTHDRPLIERHSCDVESHGGRCEDYPCCGHELGDCNGELYGSDEYIKAEHMRRLRESWTYGDDDYAPEWD